MASDVSPKVEGPLWKPEKEPNKKKHLAPSQVQVRNAKYRRFRKAFLKKHVLENGWYECNVCRKQLKYPEVDHIVKRSVAPDRVFDETNLQVICPECHAIKDNGMTIKRSYA